jgi:large subunit ribosomal protein MRP49
MTVKQTDDQEGPAAITIYFAGRPSDAATNLAASINDQYAPAQSSSEEVVVIDAKAVDYQEIWRRVQAVTGAQEVQATPEEKASLETFEKMRLQTEVDRTRVTGIRQAKKDQARMLQEARGEVEKLRQL